MLRVRNTFCTRPGPLYMWKIGPSLVTMPAASWPRCCSSSRPSYSSWLTGVCATTPTMPHMRRLRPFCPRGHAAARGPRGNNRVDRPIPAAARASVRARRPSAAGQGRNSATNPACGSVVSPATSTNASTRTAPRAMPNTAPRKRSTKPSPDLRMTLDSGHAISAPSTSARDQDQRERDQVAHDRLAAELRQHRADQRRERDRGDEPQHPRDQRDHLARHAAHEARAASRGRSRAMIAESNAVIAPLRRRSAVTSPPRRCRCSPRPSACPAPAAAASREG